MTLALSMPLSFLAATIVRENGLTAKPGVAWKSAKGEPARLVLLAGLYRVQWAVEAAGLGPLTVTSVWDGTHLPDSRHYVGLAADLRTHHLSSEADRRRMWEVVAEALGPGWDVILEVDHIHIEFDPRAANAAAAYLGTR